MRGPVKVEWMIGCSRCDAIGHANVTFQPMARPMELVGSPPLTHWAPCPTNGDPILMFVDPGDNVTGVIERLGKGRG
jgi:hypothetical protein